MNTHIFAIASSFAVLGSHMYPGNAVTERKYSGNFAATWNEAMPPFDGPAMWNLPPWTLYSVSIFFRKPGMTCSPPMKNSWSSGAAGAMTM